MTRAKTAWAAGAWVAVAATACGADTTTCDATTLEWAVIELSETEAFERPTIAAHGLLEACADAIPEIHRERLHAVAHASVIEGMVGPPDPDDVERDDALLLSACPASLFFEITSTDASQLERRRQRFRQCGFDALGLMDEAEFVRHDHVAAFSLFAWLRDQGIDEEISRVLVREALVRGRTAPPLLPAEATTLSRSWSSSAVDTGPRVYLSATAMSFGDEELSTIEDGMLASGTAEAAMSKLLFDLEESRLTSAPFEAHRPPHVVLVPDQGIVSATLYAVMETAAAAGIGEFQIVGVQPEVRFPELGMYAVELQTAVGERGMPAPVIDASPTTCSPPQLVAPGTAVFWPDGREAGTTTREVRFDEEPVLLDGLACFETAGTWLCLATVPATLG